MTTESEAIDSMSYNLAMVFFTYLLTFMFLKLLTFIKLDTSMHLL